MSHLKHLDDCVDDVKKQAAVRDRIWDKRWATGIGIIIGACLVTGSGTISLKHLIELIAAH